MVTAISHLGPGCHLRPVEHSKLSMGSPCLSLPTSSLLPAPPFTLGLALDRELQAELNGLKELISA